MLMISYLETWRIIPGLISRLGSPPFPSHKQNHLEGEQPYLGDLLTMLIDHLLDGTILQVFVFGDQEECFGSPLVIVEPVLP